MTKVLPLLLGLMLTLGLKAQTDLIISEYVEGWSTNKAIEIFNPTSEPINLSGYYLVRYANGEDVPPAADDWKVALPDAVLEPYRTFVCVIDKRDPEGTGQEAPVWEQLQDRADVFLCPNYAVSNTLYHNGDDALALEKTDGTLVDLFGRWGSPRPAEATIGGSTNAARCWTDTPPYFTGVGVGITADHTLVRKSDVVNGVTVNPDMFNPLEQWDSLSANTFDHLGWHVSSVSPGNATPAFAEDFYEFKVWKGDSDGKVVATLEATDAEEDALKYFINGGNFIYDDMGTPDDFADDDRLTPFELDKTSGELKIRNAASFQHSTNDSVWVNVSVNDGFTESDWISVLVILSDNQVGKEDLANERFEVYPNPFKDQVEIKSAKAIQSLSLINGAGQKVYTKSVNSTTAVLQLNEIKRGVYMIEATYNDGSSNIQRIVKE